MIQAIDAETDRADQLHAQERAERQQEKEQFEKEVTAWKVQYFDQKYER